MIGKPGTSVALIRESLLLNDSEVTVSYLKFMLGVAILNFPAMASHLGILNSVLASLLLVILVAKSNLHLVKAIPLDLMG
jgi:hypothetical protein